jgi:hypothetical protein
LLSTSLLSLGMSESLVLVPNAAATAAKEDVNDAAEMLVALKNDDASGASQGDASAEESAFSLPADLPSDSLEYAPSSEPRERPAAERGRHRHSSRRSPSQPREWQRHCGNTYGPVNSGPRPTFNVTVHAQHVQMVMCGSCNSGKKRR